MNNQFRIFKTAFLISCKHSSRWLLCLLCVIAICGGLVAALLMQSAADTASPSKMTVAVVSHDDNPMTQGILRSISGSREMSELIELMFYSSREEVADARCVITIPQGFLESVLTGENLTPTVEYDASGAMESLWARQLSVAGARALSAAQRGVYATQELTDYGANMDARTYGLLIANVNLRLMNGFLTRENTFEEERLSAAGTLTLTQHYLAAILTAFFFVYAFLFYPALDALRQFSRQAKCGLSVFCAGAGHALVLYFIPVAVIFAVLAGGVSASVLTSAGLFALICATFSLAICMAFASRAACAAGCMLLTTGMSLCAGLLLPLILLPRSFSAIAPFLPVHHAFALVSTVLTHEMPNAMLVGQTLAVCGVLLAVAAVAWRVRGEGERAA